MISKQVLNKKRVVMMQVERDITEIIEESKIPAGMKDIIFRACLSVAGDAVNAFTEAIEPFLKGQYRRG
jgi:hypothetical protein